MWTGLAGLSCLISGLAGDGVWLVGPSWQVVIGVAALLVAADDGRESVQARRTLFAWRRWVDGVHG